MKHFLLIFGLALAACTNAQEHAPQSDAQTALHPNETPQMRLLIIKYAKIHDIPEALLHAVILRESNYRPHVQNGPYYGLMQILLRTAQSMRFSGTPSELLMTENNLIYAGKYLRGAWIVSNSDIDTAVEWYALGYY